uniref:Uncharacterized protein n=1 Tax=Ditylenchus dipsaci TaxID=166011 RepID=A0A915DEW2_9BILA
MNMNVFVVAYNQRVCTTKEISFLAVWVYNKEENACHLIEVKRAAYEAISCLAVSENGSYTAFGTTNCSVGIFDSHNLHDPLLLASKVTFRSLRRWNFYLNKLPLLRNGSRNFRTVKRMDRNRQIASSWRLCYFSSATQGK